MGSGQLDNVLRHIRSLAAARTTRELRDRELLERFVAGRDETAFAGIVERHGPLVLGVCQRILRDAHHSEDACQATFLVLARKAGAIRKRDSLGSWLHGVARRVASRLRADIQRRAARDVNADEVPRPDTTAEITWREGLAVLDEELSRLPATYRAALILCYLEARTHEEAARELGYSLGAFRGRLERARQSLRDRLIRRGVGLSTAALGTVLVSTQAAAALPSFLAVKTVKAACQLLAGQALWRVVPAHIATLTEGVVTTMYVSRMIVVGSLLLAASVLVAGAGALRGGAQSEKETAPANASAAVAPVQPADEKASERESPARSTARPFLEQALQAAADVKDPAENARILVLVAKAQAATGDRAAARHNLQRAFELGNALPNENIEDFYRRHILREISEAQAELGDMDRALKTLDAYRKPKDNDDMNLQDWVNHAIAAARVRLACAQARAGRHKEAADTISGINKDVLRNVKWPLVVETAVAQARAGDWKQARETATAIEPPAQQIAALLAIARLQAKARLVEEARARIAGALEVVPRALPGDSDVQYSRATLLQGIAQAQSDVGDVKSALATADAIPELPPVANVRFPPIKQITLATVLALAGDSKGANEVIRDMELIGGDVPRLIARTQAKAKDVKGALKTAARIESPFHKTLAYMEIAQTQARAGDRDGAAGTFAKAVESVEAVPEVPPSGRDYPPPGYESRLHVLRALASAHAGARQEKAASAWIAQLQSANLKAWALVGLAEGIAKRKVAADAPAGAAASDPITIRGQVLDPDGKPVRAAWVCALHGPAQASRSPDNYSVDLTDETKTDTEGRFELRARAPGGEPPPAPIHPLPVIVVRADGYGYGVHPITDKTSKGSIVIRLPREQVLRARFVDDSKNKPVKDLVVKVASVWHGAGQVMAPAQASKAWFAAMKTDAQGRIQLRGIGHASNGQNVFVEWRDAHFLAQRLDLWRTEAHWEGKEVVFKLLPPLPESISGRVTFKDTGKPAAGVNVRMRGNQTKTDGEGRFRLKPDWEIRTLLQGTVSDLVTQYLGWVEVDAPAGTAYLGASANAAEAALVSRTLNRDGTFGGPFGSVDLKIALPHGGIVRGRVLEAGTNKAVPGASVSFRGKDVQSGPDGAFSLTTTAGSGLLIVRAGEDYVPVKTMIHKGFTMAYGHAIVPVDLKEGTDAKPLTISLRRGVVVKGKLTGPNGQPVQGAVLISQMMINRYTGPVVQAPWPVPSVPVSADFELRGCDPEKACPVIFFQEAKSWGALVQVSGKQAGKPLEVRLQPCGAAKARFLGADGRPLTQRRTIGDLAMVLAGPDTPVWSQFIWHSNIRKDWETDAQGRINWRDLVPGVTYRVHQRDFTVKAGEVLDLGDLK
jgi:RNA polymerase sigma factor (sigma-70 family)